MKRIIAITTPRNEGDLIESYCRYYLTFCDMVLIGNNPPGFDNTKDIVLRLIEEGLSINFIEAHLCKEEICKIAIEKYGADLVLPFDPDEFLFHINGDNPRTALEKLPEDKEHWFCWRNYIYDQEPGDNSRFISEYFTTYTELASSYYYKTIYSKFLLKQNAMFTAGTHALWFFDNEIRKKIPVEISNELLLGHFPVRSIMQTVYKVASGRAELIIRGLYGEGIQWTEPYKILCETGALTQEQVRLYSICYAVPEKDKKTLLVKNGAMPMDFLTTRIQLRYTDYMKQDMNFILRSVLNGVEISSKFIHNQHNQYINQQNQYKEESSKTIASLENDLLLSRKKIQELEASKAAIFASNSWRITKPLRALRRMLHSGN